MKSPYGPRAEAAGPSPFPSRPDHYRLLAENVADIIWTMDLDLRLTYVSPSVLALRGYTEEEAMAQNVAQMLAPESLAAARLALTRTLEWAARATSAELTAWRSTREMELKRKDGSTFWAEVNMRLLLDADGRPQQLLGVTRDISERRRHQEDLRQAQEGLERRVEERTRELEALNQELRRQVEQRRQAEAAVLEGRRRLAEIIDFLPDPTVVIDRQGRVRAWNRAIEELSGIPAAEMLGQGQYAHSMPFYGRRRPALIDLVLDFDPEVARSYMELQRIGDKLRSLSFHPHLGSGGMYLTGTAGPLYDSRGEVVGAIESLRDVTEQRRAQEERDRLFELSPDLLCVAGFDGYFKQLNPAWTKVLGWSLQELKARPWLDLVHPDDRVATLAAGRKLMEGGADLGFENRYQCRDGSYRWIYWHSLALPEQGLFYCVAHDATKRRDAERERLQWERLQAAIETAGAVCHELNQPLQAAMTKAEVLLMRHGGDPALAADLGAILSETQRMADIGRRLLNITSYRTKDYLEGTRILDLGKSSGS